MQRTTSFRTYRRVLPSRAAWALAFVVVFALAAQARARMVEVPWTPDAPGAEIATRDQARAAGFKRAVFEEALDLLPGTLDTFRAELLRQYLAPHAAEYVLSYSEVAQGPAAPAADAANATTPDAVDQAAAGMVADALVTTMAPAGDEVQQGLLRLDVTVNRAGLKRRLKQMGVYYTTTAAQPYDLGLSGTASAAWDEIGRLQTLTGVSVVRGAEPLLEIDSVMAEPSDEERKAGLKEAAPMWELGLSADGARWSARGRDLETAWFSAWKGWFSRPGAEAGMVDELTLTVGGWYATDGIKAFADEMGAWEGAVESAELREVLMLPDGMSGVFGVKTMDRDALEGHLAQTLPQRGLTWSFTQ
jgi:hypothetical protein